MAQAFSELHWLGILVAFIAYSFLGALWFTVLFKRPYLRSLGRENEPQQKAAPIFFIGPSICMFIITLTTALLINLLNLQSQVNTLVFALIVGVGYLVANTVNIAINPNIPRPLLYGTVTGFYHLVGISIACIILFEMK